jgi:hypothetical protein
MRSSPLGLTQHGGIPQVGFQFAGPRSTAAKYSNAIGFDRVSLASNAQIRAQTGLVDRHAPSSQRGVRGSSPLSLTEIAAGNGSLPIRDAISGTGPLSCGSKSALARTTDSADLEAVSVGFQSCNAASRESSQGRSGPTLGVRPLPSPASPGRFQARPSRPTMAALTCQSRAAIASS